MTGDLTGGATNEADARARFLAAMSRAAQTVNIVTTDGPAGRAGVTVSAMTSVSADTEKPTLLICVHRASGAAQAILANRVFCVNVLRDDQTRISDIFAGRHGGAVAERFDHADWVAMPSGAPRVVEPLVAFDCRMVSADLVGLHHVFFGEVGEIFIAGRGSPLIYARRSYGAAAPIGPAQPPVPDLARGDRLTLASIPTIGATLLPGLVRKLHNAAPEVAVTLVEGDQARVSAALAGGEVELALMHDDGTAAAFVTEPVAEIAPSALVPADDPLSARAALAPEDFAGRPLVVLTASPGPERLLASLRAEGVEPRVALRSDSIETVRAMVAEGLGIALIEAPKAGSVRDDGPVLARPLAWPVPPARLLLARREGALSFAAECFLGLCREASRVGQDHA